MVKRAPRRTAGLAVRRHTWPPRDSRSWETDVSTPAEPTISVVVPVHNKASHLHRCYESILAQTSPINEIVFVDDASTDDSRAILRSFDDPRVRLVERDPPSAGPGGARNAGIRAATGDWVAFLDADDAWLPNLVATLRAEATTCGDGVGVIFAGFENDYDGLRKPHEYVAMFGHLGRRRLNFQAYLEAWLACGRSPMHTSSTMIRRQVLHDVGLFPEGPNARRGQDIALWLKCVAHADVVSVPDMGAVYHRVSTNMVTKTTSLNVTPALCFVVRDLLPSRSPAEQSLLKQLNNYILFDYARVSKYLRGQPFDPALLRHLYPLEGVRDVARTVALVAAPLGLLRALRRVRLRAQAA
jgi:glycosyltransferase involved in cell wall biosynthesis